MDCRDGYLLVDAGWAGSLARPRAELGRHGVDRHRLIHTHARQANLDL
ncbi:MAG: hypothetical protein M1389_09785 [Chloroflexi bacterium]|nr:hypothetical protein [Chloroflexota bacterium]